MSKGYMRCKRRILTPFSCLFDKLTREVPPTLTARVITLSWYKNHFIYYATCLGTNSSSSFPSSPKLWSHMCLPYTASIAMLMHLHWKWKGVFVQAEISRNLLYGSQVKKSEFCIIP